MADTEVEEDDLEKLDVPDIPSGKLLNKGTSYLFTDHPI